MRKVQQVNASAAFAKDIITGFEMQLMPVLDKVMARVLDSAENKSKSDEEERAFKLSIYDEDRKTFLNQCEAIVNYVSK